MFQHVLLTIFNEFPYNKFIKNLGYNGLRKIIEKCLTFAIIGSYNGAGIYVTNIEIIITLIMFVVISLRDSMLIFDSLFNGISTLMPKPSLQKNTVTI